MLLTSLLVHRLAQGETRGTVAARARIDELRLLTLEEHHDRATLAELTRLARALKVGLDELVHARRLTVTLDVTPPEVEPDLRPAVPKRRRAK